MSSSDNNITFKKTSFLSGINSEFINQFYSDYLSDPKSLPESWRNFFDGYEFSKINYEDIDTIPVNIQKEFTFQLIM